MKVNNQATCGQWGSNACGELDASSSKKQEAETYL
jgi:hypothetical protein